MGRTPAGQTRERILRFVRERLLTGLPPTVREVQQAFGFRAVQTAREHLEGLVGEGLLSKEAGKSRGYRLPGGGEPPMVHVPVLGRVPAGSLETAIEDLEGHIPIRSRHAPGDLFGLRVRGESMTGAGIMPRDIVVVRRQPTAQSGEIVVARVEAGVESEATVKRLRIRGKRIELCPENPAYEVIVPDPKYLTLLGKVIEVRRSLEA